MSEFSIIQSVQNSMVKHAYSLKKAKSLKESVDFLCEGFHLVEEALASGLNLRYVFATPEVEKTDAGKKLQAECRRQKTRWVLVQAKIIDYVSETATPQGILAVVEKPAARWPAPETQIVLCVDQVQDAGNVGTLLRSAEAFGAGGVLLTEGSCDVFNPKVVRSAMGALFRLPVQEKLDWQSAMEWLKANGFQSLALTSHGAPSLVGMALPQKTALWVGSEGAGLSEELMAACDAKVSIPMTGKVESLNAGVAGSLALFWVRNQKPVS
ncbi:MAG TPA: RNA methyltransferase [bacterium]|nr:RNA methyltransferase [bacterium]